MSQGMIKELNKRNSSYRGIPCWYNPITDEIKGKNWFYDQLVSIFSWFDLNVLALDAIPLWVDVDELEQN